MKRSTTQTSDLIRDLEHEKARRWLIAHWSPDDRNLVLSAIRDSVIEELKQRDTREYNIPPNGDICVMDPESKRLVPDPVLASQRRNGRDESIEVKHRWRTWIALKPDPVYVYDWVRVIEEDDGKDEFGNWLCGPHGGKRYSRHQMSANPELIYHTGFGKSLPKWLREPNRNWCVTDDDNIGISANGVRGGFPDPDSPPRRRGRPKGSKNKPRDNGDTGDNRVFAESEADSGLSGVAAAT